MKLFLTIREGETAYDAEPLLATDHPDIIRAAAREIAARMGLAVVDEKDPGGGSRHLAVVGDDDPKHDL